MRQRPPTSFFVRLAGVLVVVVGLLPGVFGSEALAQSRPPGTAAAPPSGDGSLPDVSRANLEELAATLQDPARRQTLLDQIDALIQVQGKPQETPLPATLSRTLVEGATVTARQTRAALVEVAGYLGRLARLSAWLHDLLADPAMRAAALQMLLELLAVLAPPVVVELALRQALRGTARSLDARPSEAITAKVPLVLLRALLEIVPVLGFLAAAYLALMVVAPAPQVGFLALNLANAYALTRAIMIAARRLLAPEAPGLRLLPLGGEAAALVYGWVRRFAVTAVLGYFLIEIARLLGLPGSAYLLLLRVLGLVLALLAIVFILRVRGPVARVIRHGQAPLLPEGALAQQLRNAVAALWHLAAIAYVLLVFVVIGWRVEDGGAYLLRGTIGTILLFVIASALMAWLEQLVRRNLRASEGELAHQPGARERLRSYARIASHVLRALVALAALLGILYLWGVDTPAWLDLPVSRFVLRVVGTAAVASLLGVIVWEMVSAAVERALRAREDEEGASARSARMRTILPLLRKVVLVTLGTLIVPHGAVRGRHQHSTADRRRRGRRPRRGLRRPEARAGRHHRHLHPCRGRRVGRRRRQRRGHRRARRGHLDPLAAPAGPRRQRPHHPVQLGRRPSPT